MVKVLTDRGMAAGDLTIVTALDAIRRRDYDRGLALARQVFSASSTYFGDHLVLAQLFLAAQRPREAGQELRRAVELGPGVPITWVSYVRYLVQSQEVDQAGATVNAARKALAADRANLALAQCYGLVGDTKQAEAMIQAALQSPHCDLATIRVATDLCLDLGRPDLIELVVDKLRAPALKATPDVLAWATRTHIRALLNTGRPADVDRALALVRQNLIADPTSREDQRLRALLLAQRTSRRGEAIKLLEPLAAANELGTAEQFILAQAYLVERLRTRYRAQMLKILAAGSRNPEHLVHFANFLIGRQELDQADHWLAELGRVAPQSLALLELEARLLKARNREGELRERLLSRGRQAPDELWAVAGLLDRFGFAREAEAAYKHLTRAIPTSRSGYWSRSSFLASARPDPRSRSSNGPAVTSLSRGGRGDGDVALGRPLGRRGPQASGGGLGRRGHPLEPRRGPRAPPRAGRHVLPRRAIRRGRGPPPRDPGQRSRSRRGTQ